MENVELAFLAIKGLGLIHNLNGGRVLEICRAAKLSTDDAVSLRKMIAREWRAGNANIDMAREFVNRYARDYKWR